MPKLTKSQKKALMKKVQKAFDVIGKEFTAEEKERILADTERDRVHELGEKYVNFRTDHNAFLDDHYPDFKRSKFKRFIPFYLDMSGTPEADEKNRALLASLSTEEGCKKFAQQAAGEILSMDMRLLKTSGNVEKDVKTYAAHAREIELCWVAQDLTDDAKEYLDPQVCDLIAERLPMIQASGDYIAYVQCAASDLYTVMPELTTDDTDKIQAADNANDPDGLYQIGLDERFVNDFTKYNYNVHIQQANRADKMGKVMEKAVEMEKDGTLTPFTIAKNKKGERLKLSDGIAASLKGENITFEENAADKPMISSYINEAKKPIRMPEKNSALYDTFSAEALSAQGKGLQAECARLSGIMDAAKLWYTGGSHEFRETARLLKEIASGDVPNKDESLEKINQILALCNKYVKDKDDLQLKPREQKRLDAVNAVIDSLYPKKDFLATVKLRGDSRHYEAASGAGDKVQPFHTSTENQRNYHIAESDRKAAMYRKEIEGYKGAGGALGRLAFGVEKTVTRLADDSISEKTAGVRPKFISDGTLPRAIAEMALLEFIRAERAQAQKNNTPVSKGKTEKMLDEFSKDNNTWERAIARVARTETVRKLTEDIAESPRGAAEYFVKNGPQKLLADLNKELMALASGENKENVKKAKADTKKVPSKSDPQLPSV